MQYIPAGVIIVGLTACLGTLLAGLVMAYRMGGWQAMMQPTPQGKWSLPRRLVYGGAMGFVAFNMALILLTLIPGALPWK